MGIKNFRLIPAMQGELELFIISLDKYKNVKKSQLNS